MTTCSRYLSLMGNPRCNLRTGRDGERLRLQLTSVAQSSWKLTKAVKPQTKKGRRAACWNVPRERIQMDPSHIAIRWGKDFAARGNKETKSRKMQYKHPETKDLRTGQFDGILRAIGEQKKPLQKRSMEKLTTIKALDQMTWNLGSTSCLCSHGDCLGQRVLRESPALLYYKQ